MIIISRFWALVVEKITYYALNHVDGCFYENYPATMKERACHRLSTLTGMIVSIALYIIWM